MDVISKERQSQILRLLSDIEQEHNITIIRAVESGSRAWGFPSADSDYDIRFIYHHPQAWYITAFEKKDHIDIVIEDDLDAGGWDIGKCLRLLYKGNAVLQEWLNSPVVYRSDENKHKLLRDFSAGVFNPAAGFYHYYSQVKKRLAEDKTRTNAKAFLYGFRSLLCAKWIAEKNSVPPVLFDVLVQEYLINEEKQALDAVLEQKAEGGEKDSYQIPEVLWEIVKVTFEDLRGVDFEAAKHGSYEEFDYILKKMVM